MFRMRSWIQRMAAGLGLVASLVGGTVVGPHAEGLDDAACSPRFVAHDASAHQLSAPSRADVHEQHCFLCHALRSFCSATGGFEQGRRAVDAERVVASDHGFLNRLDWTAVSGRAPPL